MCYLKEQMLRPVIAPIDPGFEVIVSASTWNTSQQAKFLQGILAVRKQNRTGTSFAWIRLSWASPQPVPRMSRKTGSKNKTHPVHSWEPRPLNLIKSGVGKMAWGILALSPTSSISMLFRKESISNFENIPFFYLFNHTTEKQSLG